MHHNVKAGRHGRHHERRGNILACQQRQGTNLGHRITRRVRVNRAHTRQARVKRNEHIQGFRLTHLTNEDAVRAHTQSLLDQAAQLNRASSLKVRLAALQTHHIAERNRELKDLFARNHALTRRNRCRQAVQHRGLTRLGCTRHEDVHAALHRRVQQGRRAGTQRVHAHQVGQAAGTHHELTDIDARVPAGNIRNHRVQAGAIRQGCVNKRGGKIHTATRRLEHTLQQAIDRLGAQVQAGQFTFAVTGDKDFIGRVDPDFFNALIIKERLNHAEAADFIVQALNHGFAVAQIGQGDAGASLFVIVQVLVDEPANGALVLVRVQAAVAHCLTDIFFEQS